MVSRNELEQVRETIRRMSAQQRATVARELSRGDAGREGDDAPHQPASGTDDASPFTEQELAERRRVLKEILDVADEIRSHTNLDGITIRELIEEGRRY